MAMEGMDGEAPPMYQDEGMQQQQLDDGNAYQHDGSDAPMQESMEDAPGVMP